MSETLIRSYQKDFSQLAQSQPDEEAVCDKDGRSLTYRELSDNVDRMHAFLLKLGVSEESSVLALMPNSIETVLVFLACLRGGLRYAPLPCNSTSTEIHAAINHTRADILLLAGPACSMHRDTLKVGIPVHEVDIGGSLDWLPQAEQTEYGQTGKIIITTSGTTSESKAVLIDGDRLWSAGRAFVDYYELGGSRPRFWNFMPMSYLGGLFNLAMIPLAAGGSFLVDEPFSGKSVLTFWPVLERKNITVLWLVPSIIRALLKMAERVSKDHHHEGVRHCFIGTAPIHKEEKERFEDTFGIQLLENYGLSETTFISAEQPADLSQRSEGSVGKVLPFVEVAFASTPDEDAEDDDSQDRIGKEIIVQSPFMMLGYLMSDGSLNESLDEAGYLHTGDLGTIQSDQLCITSRIRDVIKKGGYMISLPEIERLAAGHPDVVEAVAVSVEHSFYGESYVLFIHFHDNKQDLEGFEIWLQENLVRHKWPERVVVCDEFPRTRSGKVRKSMLVQEGRGSGEGSYNA